MKFPEASKRGSLSPLMRGVNYLLAPFRPSQWKKAVDEIKALTPRKATHAAIKVAFYYVLFCPLVAMPFYNTCIFHPYVTGDYGYSELGGIKKQDVYFENQAKQRLHGWYFANPNAKKTVLFSHGNAGNLTHRKTTIEMLLYSGASVFIYDYSGYGLSHGSPSVNNCCEDAVAAYDYLKNKLKVKPESIILYGESIGTGFTCQLAKQRSCAAIILQSPFQSLPQIAREKVPLACIYPSFTFPVNHLDTLSYLKNQHPPVLLIHGQKDDLIPAHNSEDLYKCASEKKSIVRLPNAGHNDVSNNVNFECLSALSSFLH